MNQQTIGGSRDHGIFTMDRFLFSNIGDPCIDIGMYKKEKMLILHKVCGSVWDSIYCTEMMWKWICTQSIYTRLQGAAKW